MTGTWLPIVVTAGVALLGLLLLVALWASRTRALSHRVGSFSCAVADGADGPWARGVAQYGATSLYWWRRASLVPRPASTWARAGIRVLERRRLPSADGSVQAVVVHCEVRDVRRGVRSVHLHMSDDAYAGFTSWIEATPSRVGTVI
ncbi:DUF2550 family protein [Cellulomonas oligotrophica]|uniref:DUF2550 domain-containing protein n=1 Tax=Cellulomonas oligotrophica TaxID=931536 RepID=A0A7Y9FI35_9CELL|nr:DUF2550 family protein [Cellulomonas oligotrophica]NYD87629.1 hypothetical protein [Cellulomonas oligotrophica]GIG33506.1 hypothetical protein Col01nite_26650 [Cellulomonas oligotrophica]